MRSKLIDDCHVFMQFAIKFTKFVFIKIIKSLFDFSIDFVMHSFTKQTQLCGSLDLIAKLKVPYQQLKRDTKF